jgi:dethiobiotin synthetase
MDAGQKIVAVVGAGTGVGKTFVGCGLITSARRRGLSYLGLKPIESGVAEIAEDAVALGSASGRAVAPRYALAAPMSPHRAARAEGVAISLEEVSAWVRLHGTGVVVVETAGGLLSPLADDGRTNLDLCEHLAVDAVLAVAKDELGALHDVTALMMALRSRGLEESTVVILNQLNPLAAELENAVELRRLGVASRVAVVREAASFDALVAVVERVFVEAQPVQARR